MALWAPNYINTDYWSSWQMASLQHAQLLETGGFLCKVLFKNQTGQEVGDLETPIPIVTWDTSVAYHPCKKIWKAGDDILLYPEVESIRVFVDGTELNKTYSAETISANTEFYAVSQSNILGIDDNVAIYLNTNFVTTGKTITYLYTTRNKGVDIRNLQPRQDLIDYRTEYGFTQYTNTTATFRGKSYPHTIAVSFPIEPPLDTTYAPYGRTEIWQSRAWAMGTPKLHEFDILWRQDNGKYYEIKDWSPDIKPFRGEWKLFVQAFNVSELQKNDPITEFPFI